MASSPGKNMKEEQNLKAQSGSILLQLQPGLYRTFASGLNRGPNSYLVFGQIVALGPIE